MVLIFFLSEFSVVDLCCFLTAQLVYGLAGRGDLGIPYVDFE